MGKVKLRQLKDVSPFRKVAMGSWKTAKDPSVYSYLAIDMQPVLKVLPEYIKKHNVKVTPSHLVGRAIAYCMERRPEINGMIRGKKIYLREQVSVFYQVNIPGDGPDKIKKATLSGCVIHGAEKMSVAEMARSMQEKALKIKSGKDKEMKRNLEMFKYLPWWITGFYLDFASFLMYGLNLDLSWLGLPKDPFGSVMVTNIGSLGIDIAYVPLCPYTRVPIILTIGATKDEPVVIDGKVEVRPIMPMTVTFDHRLIDGVHAAQMARDFKNCFADPEKYLLYD